MKVYSVLFLVVSFLVSGGQSSQELSLSSKNKVESDEDLRRQRMLSVGGASNNNLRLTRGAPLGANKGVSESKIGHRQLTGTFFSDLWNSVLCFLRLIFTFGTNPCVSADAFGRQTRLCAVALS